MTTVARPVDALLKTVPENPESVGGRWRMRHATPNRVLPPGGCCSGAWQTLRPCAGNRRAWRAPPAPDTSWRPVPGSGPSERVAARFPEAVPPEPTAATPSSRSDQSGVPDRRGYSRNGAPVPAAASLVPARSRVRKIASSDPGPERRLRSSPRGRRPPCRARVVPKQRRACSRR